MAAEGAQGEHKHPNYMLIFWILLVLTIVEVAIPLVLKGPDSKVLRISLLSIFAIAKAGLVGLYFMHLKYEKLNLRLMVLLPVLFSAILTGAVLWEAGYISAIAW
ncbi:MAG: cytochrome C oxidase subunit IV family protein [Planctomycetota bacterium]|jgi:cytochrome c oxidase subunit 4